MFRKGHENTDPIPIPHHAPAAGVQDGAVTGHLRSGGPGCFFLLDLMDVMGVNGVSWDLDRDLVGFHGIQ